MLLNLAKLLVLQIKSLRSKRGIEFSMAALATIIIIVIGILIFLIFYSSKWGGLTGKLDTLEQSAVGEVEP